LDGQDVAIELEYSCSPEELRAGVTKSMLLAMTPDQARQLAKALLAAADTAKSPTAAND
jgi:hypothetical protein